jgi:hypothetical protein
MATIIQGDKADEVYRKQCCLRGKVVIYPVRMKKHWVYVPIVLRREYEGMMICTEYFTSNANKTYVDVTKDRTSYSKWNGNLIKKNSRPNN